MISCKPSVTFGAFGDSRATLLSRFFLEQFFVLLLLSLSVSFVRRIGRFRWTLCHCLIERGHFSTLDLIEIDEMRENVRLSKQVRVSLDGVEVLESQLLGRLDIWI